MVRRIAGASLAEVNPLVTTPDGSVQALAQKEELLTQQGELTTQREQLKISEERSRVAA